MGLPKEISTDTLNIHCFTEDYHTRRQCVNQHINCSIHSDIIIRKHAQERGKFQYKSNSGSLASRA